MTHHTREEIAVIGGGLGGCMTALMLAKDPHYHVTLIEAQDTLLNGASAIASRLHLGGEYPLDPNTAKDCLISAVLWKLLMPNHERHHDEVDIYTPTPPMKFLVGKRTQSYGEKNPKDKNALTLKTYLSRYERIRLAYGRICKTLHTALNWDENAIHHILFGPPRRGEFFRPLKEEEYKDYAAQVAGGFQSQERGLIVPKYLAMIEAELERQQKAGNVTILKGHKVKKDGIEARDNNFIIHCENGRPVLANQVVQAAWQGGPALTKLGKKGNKFKGVTVSRRAMLLVDLPPGHSTPPAFIMLGDDGGMMAPYNDRVAICYLPPRREEPYPGEYSYNNYNKPAAYIGECLLTDENPRTGTKPTLPVDWESWKGPMKFLGGYLREHPVLVPGYDPLSPEWTNKPPEEKWALTYFALLKQRFPFLHNATNPRLVVRDTLNFQKDVHLRRHETAEEVSGIMPARRLLGLKQGPALLMEMRMEHDKRPMVMEDEEKRGLFTLYPTKATYSVHSALQVVAMVHERSERNHNHNHPERNKVVKPPHDIFDCLLVKNGQEYDIRKSRENVEKYSLGYMKEPDARFYARFFREHPDLSPEMLRPSWAGRFKPHGGIDPATRERKGHSPRRA